MPTEEEIVNDPALNGGAPHAISMEWLKRFNLEEWNRAIQACMEIVCPDEHKEEERTCEEIKQELEKLLRPIGT